MTSRTRSITFLVFGTGLLGLLIWGVLGLSPFGSYPGPYGDILNAVAFKERHVLNVVTSVIFDYRGFDTLGEEFILFACVTAVTLLLRHEGPGKSEECPPRPRAGHTQKAEVGADITEAGQLFSALFVGLILVFGIYIVITGHLSLGGGFQGGLILSSAWLLVLLAYGSQTLHRFAKKYVVEWLESGGAGIYVLVGLASLATGKAFLTNILPLGQAGQLFSSGTILLINCAVGIEVAAGFILLLSEFTKPLEA